MSICRAGLIAIKLHPFATVQRPRALDAIAPNVYVKFAKGSGRFHLAPTKAVLLKNEIALIGIVGVAMT